MSRHEEEEQLTDACNTVKANGLGLDIWTLELQQIKNVLMVRHIRTEASRRFPTNYQTL
jgi:hypothetical protein